MKTLLGVAMIVLLVCTCRVRAQDDDEPAAARADAPRRPQPAPSVSKERLAALLARYAHEPRVEDVVRAALAAYGSHPAKLDSMMSRARLRGLIPNLELGARRGQGIDLRPSSAADVEGVKLSTDDDLVLQATLRFELGRLLFADEEVSIAREARAAHGSRAELARQTVELYFKRKRLLLERDLSERSDVDHEVRIAETEALLDAFTNGAWQRMMSARSSAWTTDAPTRATPSP